MPNFTQLGRLNRELDHAVAGESLSTAERDLATRIRAAAQEARDMEGYLFIVGD